MKAAVLTHHAIERYMQRSGSKRMERTIRKLFRIADKAVQIGPVHFYADGWIIIVNSGEIITVYRPSKRWEHKAIFNAMRKRRLTGAAADGV